MNGAVTTMLPVFHYSVMLRHEKKFLVLKDCVLVQTGLF